MFGECHAHIMMDGVDYARAKALHAEMPNDNAIRDHLFAYASRGILFIRDGGDPFGVTGRAKELAHEVGIDYRTPIFGLHKCGHYGKIAGIAFDNLREYAKLVEEAAREGADFVKIMTTGIMDFERYGRITGEDLSFSEVKEMVHIAHEMGFAVMSHTNGKRAVLDVLEAGADSVEHANFIDAEVLDAFAETGAVYVPTATVARNLIGKVHGSDDVLRRIWEQSAATMRAAFGRGDVVMAIGSDGGAVGVLHGAGTESEYACFLDACGGPSPKLDARLEAGEAQIRARFRRH